MSAGMVEGWVAQFSKLRENIIHVNNSLQNSEKKEEAMMKQGKKIERRSSSCSSNTNPLRDSILSEETVFMLMDRFAPNWSIHLFNYGWMDGGGGDNTY